jgi:hypothetical protein
LLLYSSVQKEKEKDRYIYIYDDDADDDFVKEDAVKSFMSQKRKEKNHTS